MSDQNHIEDDALAANEYALPSNAAPIVEMALAHQEVVFVLEEDHAITFLVLHTDGSWEVEQS